MSLVQSLLRLLFEQLLLWLPIKLKHSGLFHPPFMVMKVELGLSVWDCSLASTATLLPPLWPDNGINLAFASRAQRSRSTSLAQPPLLHSTHPWLLLPACLVLGWQGRGPAVPSCSEGPARPALGSPFPEHSLARTSLVIPSPGSRAPASEGQSCRHKFGKLLSYEQSYEH